MNQLSLEKRAMMLQMLCEGVSMRATSRIAQVSINTVVKLLTEAGATCMQLHDDLVRNVKADLVQCDEIWAFCYAKQRNVGAAKSAPLFAGDVWTWIAMDPQTKLLISWLAADRSAQSAHQLMADLRERVPGRFQLTTDGYRAYLDAVEEQFGADIDYGQLVKIYGEAPEKKGQARYSPPAILAALRKRIEGNPVEEDISTSIIERLNLTVRMQNRRFTRLTNGFSKRHESTSPRSRCSSSTTTSHASTTRCASRPQWRRGSRTSCGRWRTWCGASTSASRSRQGRGAHIARLRKRI